MKKWQIANSETSDFSEISKILSFLISKLSSFLYSQNLKFRFKNLEKKFLSFSSFSRFRNFRPGGNIGTKKGDFSLTVSINLVIDCRVTIFFVFNLAYDVFFSITNPVCGICFLQSNRRLCLVSHITIVFHSFYGKSHDHQFFS